MKNFLKNVFANIVAFVIIGIVGIVLLILFIAISAASQNTVVKIKKNSVLTLDAKTLIIDSPSDEKESLFSLTDKTKSVVLLDVLKAIENAKKDENIKGISIENDAISAGLTQLDDIRMALEDFKKSGKFVLTYGNNVSQPSYYLGSVADAYYLHPAGGIDLKGMSTEIMFFKDFLDKYGIGMQVIRHGKYKSAVEPYLRNDLSPENREQMSSLLNDIWIGSSKKIASSRKIDSINFKTIVDSLYASIPDNAIQYKLADKLVQKSEYDDILRSKLKIDKKEDINRVSFGNYINSLEDSSEKDRIAVLYASGAILGGEGYGGIYSVNFIKEIKKIAKDEKVKAVVLRINSPGGSANASDEILFELSELKKQKPIIVSFGDYAASGGYYIAMAADKIYSEPNTLTGSIGVFGVVPNLKKVANSNGIHGEVVATNANSNSYSPVQGLSDGTLSIMTKSVEQTYKRFVYFVTQNRKKSFEQIDEIGGGRVWSGSRAKTIGLVDELGSINDALKFAAEKAKLKSYSIDSYPKKVSAFEQFFSNVNEDQISARLIKNKVGEENFKVYEMLTDPNAKAGVMMEMPFSVSFK